MGSLVEHPTLGVIGGFPGKMTPAETGEMVPHFPGQLSKIVIDRPMGSKTDARTEDRVVPEFVQGVGTVEVPDPGLVDGATGEVFFL